MTYPLLLVDTITIVAGLLIVFGLYQKTKKPTFVKVIWILLFLNFVLEVSRVFTYHEWVNNGRYLKLYNASWSTSLLLIMVVHWLFSVEYYSAITKFTILVAPVTITDTDNEHTMYERMAWFAKCKLISVNIVFYLLVALWVVQVIFFVDYPFEGAWNYFYGFINCVSCLLLIYSIVQFKRSLRKMKSKKLFANEKLMVVHVLIYSLYIVSYFGWCVSDKIKADHQADLFFFFRKPSLTPYC